MQPDKKDVTTREYLESRGFRYVGDKKVTTIYLLGPIATAWHKAQVERREQDHDEDEA